METFPRKPFLDRVIVREIPIEEIYTQGEIAIPLNDVRVKDQSDRGIVVAVGDYIPMSGTLLAMPVQIGDLVFFDDTTLYDPVYLNPADRRRSDLPKYWQIRVGDLKGYDVQWRADVEAGRVEAMLGAERAIAPMPQIESSVLECAKCGVTIQRAEFDGHVCKPKEAPLIIDKRKGRGGLRIA